MLRVRMLLFAVCLSGCIPSVQPVPPSPTVTFDSSDLATAGASPPSDISASPHPATSAPGQLSASSTPTAGIPTAEPPIGWKTLVVDSLQIAVDYPGDWQADLQPTGALFTSPQGFAIQLAQVDTGGLPPDAYLGEHFIPNARCSSSTNDYGVSTRVCFDTLSFVYTADLLVSPGLDTARLLTMTAHGRGEFSALMNAMIASVRPVS